MVCSVVFHFRRTKYFCASGAQKRELRFAKSDEHICTIRFLLHLEFKETCPAEKKIKQ